MRWEKLTSPDFEHIDRNTPVLLNLAAVEQHGFHLPVDVDCRIGQHFCDQVDEAMADRVLVLPQIKVCCSQHHMDFAGTLTVSHTTLLAYLRDILTSINQHGFRNILLLNSHGGNQAIGRVAVEAAGPELRANGGHVAFSSWWDVALEQLLDLNESGPFGVGHAGEFETSLMMLIAPDEVKPTGPDDRSFEPLTKWSDGDLLRAAPVALYRTMRDMSGGTGIVGDPSAASPAKGQAITDLVVPALISILGEMAEFR